MKKYITDLKEIIFQNKNKYLGVYKPQIILKNYKFESLKEWNISHSYETNHIVINFYDENGNIFFPDKTKVLNNKIEIKNSTKLSGTAQIFFIRY